MCLPGQRRDSGWDFGRTEEEPVARYPNIADHGLIGDLQTAALVTTDGVLDWFCCPRFDSPSVFASLLDAERGGFYRIAPDRDDYVSRQLYLPDTAVLITRFMTPDGVGEVHDFMPRLREVGADFFLERKPRVVGTDDEFHCGTILSVMQRG